MFDMSAMDSIDEELEDVNYNGPVQMDFGAKTKQKLVVNYDDFAIWAKSYSEQSFNQTILSKKQD